MTARNLSLAADRRAVYKKALTHALLGVVPVLITLDVLYYTSHAGHPEAFDFQNELWPAAHRLLHGLSPYDRGWMRLSGGVAFPYPAFTAVAFAPLALLAHSAADWAFTLAGIAAAPLTLWVLNVRDWRVYGLTMMLWPVVLAWQTANLTLVLALGIACLWRKRHDPIVAGVLVAVIISLKPFIWPVALWLLATRRYRALAWAAGAGLLINAISWAVVGYDQIHAYTALTSAVNHVMDRRGYSIFSLVLVLGGSHTLAYVLGISVAAGVAVGCLIAGRRGNAKAALTLAIAVALLGTPVLWLHYFALIIIPLAVYRPRLDVAWLVALVMIACRQDYPTVWQIAVALVSSTVIFIWLLRDWRPSQNTPSGWHLRRGSTRKLSLAGGVKAAAS